MDRRDNCSPTALVLSYLASDDAESNFMNWLAVVSNMSAVGENGWWRKSFRRLNILRCDDYDVFK